MKNKSIVVIILVIFATILGMNSVYASDSLQFQFETVDQEYKKDDIITIDVKVSNPNLEGINVVSFSLGYDKDILEINKVYDEIEDEYVNDMRGYKGWEMDYDEEVDCAILSRTNLYKKDNEKICKVSFKVKQDFKENSIKISGIEAAGGAVNVYSQADEQINLKGTIKDVPDDLYLSSSTYKIGEDDTENYKDGDTNIYRISPNTKITDFINNLSTNGNISVYNADGVEEANYDELVKTGMILKVSKDNKEIELIISVLGDTNGDGISDISDLVELRKHIQEIDAITKKEIMLSADINEDNIIDITDLVRIRKHIQEVELL